MVLLSHPDPSRCKATFGEGTTLSQERKTLRKMHVNVNTRRFVNVMLFAVCKRIMIIGLLSQEMKTLV